MNSVKGSQAKGLEAFGLKAEIRLNEPLKNKTTFKIGGRAKLFIRPRSEKDLKVIIQAAEKFKIPFFVLGAGSNILISERGIQGIVVQLSSPQFRSLKSDNNFLLAGGGVALSELIRFSKMRGLQGAEFLAGIPGTVGGALAMNAGAWGKSISVIVEKVRVMKYDGTIKTLKKNEIRFGYRRSSLANCIILGAVFRFTQEGKAKVDVRIKQFLQMRAASGDYSYPSGGCIFKNPKGYSAGRLIDASGLKGSRIGGACISKKHANFILNRGNASADNVLRLMRKVQKQVYRKFKITLEPEIKIWQ
jgi:UDP-N-acetylmuramate dehydrogenase